MSDYALHPEAFADLDEIRDHIAQDSPDAADRVITELFNRFRTLAEFPYRGQERTDLTSRPIRFATVGEYLIAYAPEERPVWVLAVLHGRRNPRVIAALLRERGT